MHPTSEDDTHNDTTRRHTRRRIQHRLAIHIGCDITAAPAAHHRRGADTQQRALAWHTTLPDTALAAAHAITSLSLLLDRIVTPMFFFISGFLFFLNAPRFTPSVWRSKLRRRASTLLLPYILWNALFFALHSAIILTGTPPGSLTSRAAALLRSLPQAFWNYRDLCPADLPLWFVRDLIIVSLSAPLVHALVRGRRAWLSLPLLMAWLWLLPGMRCVGINPLAFFYFALGAAFSVNRISPVTRKGTTAAAAALALAATGVLAQPLFGSAFDEPVRLAAVGAAAVAAFSKRTLPGCARHGALASRLSGITFFIYAAHALFASASVRLLSGAIGVTGGATLCTVYLLSALITLAATALAYRILHGISPRTAMIMNGKRRRLQEKEITE